MPNPNPKTAHLPHQRDDGTSCELSSKATAVRLPVDITNALNNMPSKTAWLRRVIIEAAKSEGIV